MRHILVIVTLVIIGGCAVHPVMPSAGVTVSPYGVHPYVSPGGVYVTPDIGRFRRRHWQPW